MTNPPPPMPLQLEPVVAAADVAIGRVAELVRSMPDLAAPAVGSWTASDVAAHLAVGLELYARLARGAGSDIADLGAIGRRGAETSAAVTDRRPHVLAERIGAARADFHAAAREAGGDLVVPWHGGVDLPLSVLYATALGEATVHGRDISRAAGRLWPVPAADASTIVRGLLRLLPSFVDPAGARGFTGRFELRLRGRPEARAFLAFDDGRLTVEGAPGGPVDCRVSAAPVPYLWVLYGRVPPLRAALRGEVVALGRRPWLARRLATLFTTP